MASDDFHDVSAVYGLDSQILANCFKAFASYLDIPTKEWNKYHAPYKDIVNCVPARNIEAQMAVALYEQLFHDETKFSQTKSVADDRSEERRVGKECRL